MRFAKFAVGCALHLLGLIIGTHLVTATPLWRPEWNEVAGFVLIASFPVHVLPFGVYVWLARRSRWSRLCLAAAGLGFVHGLLFELQVYSWNRPAK